MANILCLIICLLPIYEALSDCSYLQLDDFSFPTGECINSTISATNKQVSISYHCHQGLLGMKIYEYQYSKPNCQGGETTYNLGFCNAPQCNCDTDDSDNSDSQCTTTTFTYITQDCDDDSFDMTASQNITVITDECINAIYYYTQSRGVK